MESLLERSLSQKRTISLASRFSVMVHFQTLGDILAKPNNCVATVEKTHAVYPIPEDDCKKEYLDETTLAHVQRNMKRPFLT